MKLVIRISSYAGSHKVFIRSTEVMKKFIRFVTYGGLL
jgi:hypothetical protein